MNDALWRDDEFRAFLTRLGEHGFFSDDDEAERARRRAFTTQARLRIVPAVRARLLAEVGVMIDPDGAAQVALEVLEEECCGRHRAWLMVTTEPWQHLSELVVRKIRSSYRATVKHTGERATLTGIGEASGPRPPA